MKSGATNPMPSVPVNRCICHPAGRIAMSSWCLNAHCGATHLNLEEVFKPPWAGMKSQAFADVRIAFAQRDDVSERANTLRRFN
jgi:hypothetical protein